MYVLATALFVELVLVPQFSNAATTDPICIAADGTARFDIVVPDETNENPPPAPEKPFAIEYGEPQAADWETAQLLARYLKESTGATFVVRKESSAPTAAGAIHLGRTRLAQESVANDPRAANLDQDGFVHHIASEQQIVILGGSELGTEYGVYDFLERHVGVRWLFPGELGEHVPANPTLSVPAGFQRDEPKFLSRLMRPHRVEGALDWARKNRSHLRVEFHHNIPKLFPAQFTRDYPELYPIIDGQRYLPPTVNMDTWHPCYSADGAVDKTAELINDFFDRYPIYSSISLGVSDANEQRNCHCARCVAQYPDKTNTLGFAERSDIYYDWCNKVIAAVRLKHPDKYFGCLAYRGVTDPPSFKVDDRLVPFLCFDRMLWADPAREAQDRKLTEGWAAVTAELGWYDYLFGRTYLVPRIYSHTLQRALQFAHEHKVRHYYGETDAAEDWFDGPYLYIAMRLLWDPGADVDALLADWCTAAVGADAAPHMVQYFEYLEDFWTNRAPKTRWFSDRSSIYLIFNARGYMDALTLDDLKQCSTMLETMESKAADGKQKERARHYRETFESRRRESLDYFMSNNAIPSDPAMTRDLRTVAELNFDEKPSGWEPFSSENRGTWHWDRAGGRNRTGAFRVDNATSVIRRGIEVKPSGKYRVSGWYKVAGALPDSARLEVMIEWRDQKRDEFRTHHLSTLLPADGGAEWRPFTMVCLPPKVAGRAGHSMGIVVSFANAPESRVLFDDITVTEIAIK